jgi:hypothetical protein
VWPRSAVPRSSREGEYMTTAVTGIKLFAADLHRAIVETLQQEQVRTPVLVLSALECAESCVWARCVAARY